MPELSLTFDDGPDARCTAPLLDLLAGRGARATFFVMSPRASEHPELIERMLAEGHTVGFHCDAHERHSTHDIGWGRRDTALGLEKLRSLGASPALWRTPWGDTAPWTSQLAEEHGLRIVGWDVDTHDWRGDDAATMFANTEVSLRDGAIVLAHDGIGPGARRSDAFETIAFVELAMVHAAREGLTLRALG